MSKNLHEKIETIIAYMIDNDLVQVSLKLPKDDFSVYMGNNDGITITYDGVEQLVNIHRKVDEVK